MATSSMKMWDGIRRTPLVNILLLGRKKNKNQVGQSANSKTFIKKDSFKSYFLNFFSFEFSPPLRGGYLHLPEWWTMHISNIILLNLSSLKYITNRRTRTEWHLHTLRNTFTQAFSNEFTSHILYKAVIF